MKLLTFLGTGRYLETTYYWQDQECTTRFSPVATCNFLQPQTLVVFLTDEARQHVFPDFQTALPKELTVIPKSIPLGKDEQQLWQIFEQVSGAVEEGEEVAFDITHGLRSFPYIGLLVAAFLQSGLGISLRAVLYGAYDVRDQSTKPPRTPMFDLTPMLTLLEWANASERFNRTGDSRLLSQLIKKQRKSLAEQAQGDKTILDQVGNLASFAGSLETISNSLRLIRPYQAMQTIYELPARAEKAKPSLQRSAPAQPFAQLLQKILETYQPLALENPLDDQNIDAMLQVSRQMVHWYAEHDQWVQAAALSREWLESWIIWQLDPSKIYSRDHREEMGEKIGKDANNYLLCKKNNQKFSPEYLADFPNAEKILSLWLSLRDVRNDILHAGMRENAAPPDTLIKNLQQYIDDLDQLPIR